MDLTDYVKENYPEVLSEYERYLRKDSLLKIGAIVKTLRAGFSGGAGVVRRVKCYCNKESGDFTELGTTTCDYMILTSGYNDSCLDVETWWKDVEIISE